MQRLRYPELAPKGYAALVSVGHYLSTETALDPVLKAMVELRCSQINGCEFCIEAHRAELGKHHEPATRIDAVAAWNVAGCDAFTPRERAALQWAELLTLLPTGGHADDDAYAAVSEFFEGKHLVDLTLAIATINAFNRLGVAFQPIWNPKKQVETSDHESSDHESSDHDALDDDGSKVVEE